MTNADRWWANLSVRVNDLRFPSSCGIGGSIIMIYLVGSVSSCIHGYGHRSSYCIVTPTN